MRSSSLVLPAVLGIAGLALGLAIAPRLGSSELSEADRTAFRAEVRAYLLDSPEVIFEAAQAMETRQAEQAAQDDIDLVKDNSDALFDDGFSWVGGNPDGDVTLVEFMDYRCSYCRKAFEDVEQLVESDGNIRFVLKEFPILGESSVAASRLAIATRLESGDDAYKALHDAMMTYTGGFDEVASTRLLEGLGLDPAPILARLSDDVIDEEIATTRRLAQQMNITGTPTFVLSDTMLRGYLPLASMREMVADIRSE
ncbi:DsbA family protein [Pseudooceanicola algae]|uniref:Uncharacterized protein n=1 Tax=Pseudooceanicola algae TaxID=1537215 RepID=A0A418SDJ0_9RHOB|nr:DsbA family protein [Pseudooceanicola algae]QPM89413.1 hypothetical protein PSAL_006320 [Pseudooceanicola algae]